MPLSPYDPQTADEYAAVMLAKCPSFIDRTNSLDWTDAFAYVFLDWGEKDVDGAWPKCFAIVDVGKEDQKENSVEQGMLRIGLEELIPDEFFTDGVCDERAASARFKRWLRTLRKEFAALSGQYVPGNLLLKRNTPMQEGRHWRTLKKERSYFGAWFTVEYGPGG